MSYAKLVRALYTNPMTKGGLAEVTGLHIWTVRGYVDVKRAAKTGAQKARERRARAKAEKLAAERALVRVGILKNFDED